FHSGDFKFDDSLDLEPVFDLHILAEIGKSGVDVFLSDSTNAHREGFCPPESNAAAALEKYIANVGDHNLFLTTFSSNFWRLRSILEACRTHNKLICLSGRGIEQTLSHASRLGMIDLQQYRIIADNESMATSGDGKVVLATGC